MTMEKPELANSGLLVVHSFLQLQWETSVYYLRNSQRHQQCFKKNSLMKIQFNV